MQIVRIKTRTRLRPGFFLLRLLVGQQINRTIVQFIGRWPQRQPTKKSQHSCWLSLSRRKYELIQSDYQRIRRMSSPKSEQSEQLYELLESENKPNNLSCHLDSRASPISPISPIIRTNQQSEAPISPKNTESEDRSQRLNTETELFCMICVLNAIIDYLNPNIFIGRYVLHSIFR